MTIYHELNPDRNHRGFNVNTLVKYAQKKIPTKHLESKSSTL